MDRTTLDIMQQLSKYMQAEIRDCVEWLEDGKLPPDEVIAKHGVLDCYEDGTKIFKWKGIECIIFSCVTPAQLAGTYKMPIYRKYLEDKING